MRNLLQPFASVHPRQRAAVKALGVVLVMGLWQAASGGLVPGPMKVLERMVTLGASADFIDNMLASLSLTLRGMGYSILIALVIAYMSVVPATAWLAQMVVQMRYMTISGLIFLFTLMTHGGSELKLALLVFGIVPFFVTSLLGVIADIQQEEYDLCTTLRMGPWRTLREVIVVGRADAVLLVISVNFAIAWMMITMVEGQSMSEGGLGTMMNKSGKYIDLATVFALLGYVLLVGWASDLLVRRARKWLFPYTR